MLVSHRVRTLCCGIVLGAHSITLAQSVPSGFAVEPVALGPFGGAPVGFAHLPDERAVIITRNGNVHLAPAGGQSSVLIHTIPDVSSTGEQGILGVAVDPQWPSRPYLYFFYSHVDSVAHVVMMTASGDLTDGASTSIVLTNPFFILSDIPDKSDIHNGGTLRFGPDGMLYVSLGDDEQRCEAQNIATLQGAILRLDVSAMPGQGLGPPPKADIAPADNPYPDLGPNEGLIYSWGHRNPFRFTVDPLTGDLFVGDVGAEAFEEIDRIAAGGGGENFGWPIREGPVASQVADTCGIGNPFAEPIFSYAHGVHPQAVICGPRIRPVPESPPGLPTTYDGQLFYCDYFAGSLRRLESDGNAWVPAAAVPGQPDPIEWAKGLGFPADIQQGPDGAIYYVSLSPFPTRTAAPEDGLYRIVRTIPTGGTLAGPESARTAEMRVRPNPARAGTPLIVECSRGPAGPATLRVFDVAGRLVRTLQVPSNSNGAIRIPWDARSKEGRPVRPGKYLLRIEPDLGASVSTTVTILP